MNCNNDLFTITKNVDNLFTFTVKADNTTVPLVLTAEDTFTASLKLLSTEEQVLNKNLNVTDTANGKVTLELLEEETRNLVALRGDAADRYYAKPSYSLVITGNTANGGKIVAKVRHVFVD